MRFRPRMQIHKQRIVLCKQRPKLEQRLCIYGLCKDLCKRVVQRSGMQRQRLHILDAAVNLLTNDQGELMYD